MHSFVNILKQTDIFHQFKPEHLEMIASFCQERTYLQGEIIFSEGSLSSELYVIVQGEIDILLDPNLVSDKPLPDAKSVVIATLRRGQSFGEISLVDRGMRSATARAAQNDTRLLSLSSTQLLDSCEEDPYFGFQLMGNLAADLALKIRNTDLLIREKLVYSTINPG